MVRHVYDRPGSNVGYLVLQTSRPMASTETSRRSPRAEMVENAWYLDIEKSYWRAAISSMAPVIPRMICEMLRGVVQAYDSTHVFLTELGRPRVEILLYYETLSGEDKIAEDRSIWRPQGFFFLFLVSRGLHR